jgi:hypothetical protein
MLATAICVTNYLRTHRPSRARLQLDFLLADPHHLQWLVRWPSGGVKWESTVGLKARGFTVPRRPIIERGAFVDPSLAREVAAALEQLSGGR